MDYPLDYFVDLSTGVTQSVTPKYLWVRRGGTGVITFSFFVYSVNYESTNVQLGSSAGWACHKKFTNNRKVEVVAKFKTPMKRFEIYEELEKLRYDFRNKLAAIIQLPGLKVVFHTHQTEQAIALREKLALSAKIEEVPRFGENEIKVTICRVPPQFKDEEFADELKTYGEIFKINALKDRYDIQIGKRHVFFKKNTMKEIPRFLTMGGVQILAYYNEQPPHCDYCKEKGHERDNCEKLQHTRAMWQKRRDKDNVEGSRYPLYDPGTQRRKGGDQQQERTQESEAESINAGCPDQEGFTIETHRKKNVKGRRCHPKNV